MSKPVKEKPYIPVNTDVCITGYEGEIGEGTIQGHDHLYGQPIVRIYIKSITSKGEKYLKSKKCLTDHAIRSRLYIIDTDELTIVRQSNGSEGKVSKGSKQKAKLKSKETS